MKIFILLLSVIHSVKKKIYNLVHHKTDIPAFKELVLNCIEYTKKVSLRKFIIEGISTGFSRLDYIMSGLRPAQFIVVASRPSMGKTAFVLNIAEHVGIINKIPVGIFNFDITKQELACRLLCLHGKLSLFDVRMGRLNSNDFSSIIQSSIGIIDTPIYIDDTVPLDIRELCTKIHRLKSEHQIRLVIIDYLQLLPLINKKDIFNVCYKLKRLAEELNITIIGVSQVDRTVEYRPDHRPGICDLTDADAIKRYADIIATILRNEYYDPEDNPGTASISICKNRNGSCGDFELKFLSNCMRFEELTQ